MVAWRESKAGVNETPRARGRHSEMRSEAEWGFGFSFKPEEKTVERLTKGGCDLTDIWKAWLWPLSGEHRQKGCRENRGPRSSP